MGGNPVGHSKAELAMVSERRAKAIQMRIAKIDYQTIADRLGYPDRQSVCRDISRALQRHRAEEDRSIDMYREQELAGLDRLQAAVWDRAISGELEAIDRCIRISQSRCRILGLNAPTEQKVITVDLVDAEIARLENKLGYERKIFDEIDQD